MGHVGPSAKESVRRARGAERREITHLGDASGRQSAHAVETWASIPDAKLCVVPDAGHFWLQEKPELANQIILDFLLKSD